MELRPELFPKSPLRLSAPDSDDESVDLALTGQ